MLKLKLFAAVIAGAILLPGVGVAVAGQTKASQEDKKEKPKGLPAEVKIPEVRTDKVLLFQEQEERVRVEQQLAIEKFKASPEWKALEDRQKFISEKLVAELSSALKLAGVEEKDFDKYTYDKASLSFKRKPDEVKK